jgi:hypothetical protein
MKTFKIIFSIIILSVVFSYCKKESSGPSPDPAKPTPYFIRMTDAPGPYTAVNIDLQSIVITGAGGSSVTLNTTPGIYNLLDFANGVDTLIATGSLTVGTVEQIRFILGPNNTVVSGGTTYPLKVPSGEQSGLKLQVHQVLQAGVPYYVLLDFDANRSVIETGNGSYQLKPVIRTIETALGGAISGQLSQAGVSAVITASSSSNAYATAPDPNGNFIIKGLPAGTYSVSVVPVSPAVSSTINSVPVTTGATTTLGVITI